MATTFLTGAASTDPGPIEQELLDMVLVLTKEESSAGPRAEQLEALAGLVSKDDFGTYEPYFVQHVLPIVLTRISDEPAIAKAAKAVGDAFFAKAAVQAFPGIVPVLFAGMTAEAQAKVDALEWLNVYIARVLETDRDLLSACLPMLIPTISGVLCDAEQAVADAAGVAINTAMKGVTNRDLTPLIGDFVAAMKGPEQTMEIIQKLSNLNFTQTVDGSTLAVIVPVIARGLDQGVICDRIVNNMVKLVEDNLAVTPVLDALILEINSVIESISVPAARAVAEKTHADLFEIRTKAEASGPDKVAREPEVIAAALMTTLGATPAQASVVNYVATVVLALIASKTTDESKWETELSPVLALLGKADEWTSIRETSIVLIKVRAVKHRNPEDALPVTVLSGFLGAGKTTLLKKILEQTHKEGQKTYKVAVLVNDMAALNIDANMVRDTQLVQAEEKLVELHNGCICCTLREDLLLALAGFAAEGKYDAVVVEGTGVSDPQEVAETFTYEFGDSDMSDELREAVAGATTLNDVARLDTCVTVVDCTTFFDRLSTAAELREAFKGSADEDDERSVGPLLMAQIEFADVIVLNKNDLVTKEQAASVEAAVKKLNPGAEVIMATRGDVSLDKVLCTDRFSMDKAAMSAGWLQVMRGEPVQPETEVYNISSFVYEQHTPFHPERLQEFLETYFTTKFLNDEELADEEDMEEHESGDDEDGEDEECEEGAMTEEDATDVPRDARDADEFERKNTVKLEKARREFGNIMRSKGYLWIAGRDDLCGEWGHAGAVLEVSNGGCWMATLPREYWPAEGTDLHKQVMDDYRGETLGDRRQALVFIGQNLKRDAIFAALDACLVKKEETIPRLSFKEEDEEAWKMGVTHLTDPFPKWNPLE